MGSLEQFDLPTRASGDEPTPYEGRLHWEEKGKKGRKKGKDAKGKNTGKEKGKGKYKGKGSWKGAGQETGRSQEHLGEKSMEEA